jgi:hypothetical protein
MSLAAAIDSQGPSTRALYEKLEDRILDRDQVGSAEAYYDLVRGGRPLTEILREAVRIHGPYTHVPYHERIDNGFVNFVNNDHCLFECPRHAASIAVAAADGGRTADGATPSRGLCYPPLGKFQIIRRFRRRFSRFSQNGA